MDIYNSNDVIYGGKGYSPTTAQKRLIQHDQVLVQILRFLEEGSVASQYADFLKKIAAEDKAAKEAAEKAVAEAEKQKQLTILAAKKAEQEKVAAEAEAAKKALEAKIAAVSSGVVEKTPAAAVTATEEGDPTSAGSEKAVDVADLNGDGKVSNDEKITRLKADGIDVPDGTHWKVVAKMYAEKYGK